MKYSTITDEQINKLQPRIKMAIMDCVPVACFAASMVMIFLSWHSVVFLIGAIICILAGLGKVAWKLNLALTHRNFSILDRQFKYTLLVGFIVMVVSVIIRRPPLSVIWKNLISFPDNILFLIAIVCFVIMGLLASQIGTMERKANRIEQTFNLIAQICILLGVVIIWYGSNYYHADEEAIACLDGTQTVAVTKVRNGYLFDGSGTEEALVFYPGAKVEYTAYAPLMMELAEEGTDCFLIEMPYNLAVFGINRADRVISKYDYDRWYVGGHSLGGSMSASYAAKHEDELAGCIMLAAYSTKDLGDLPTLVVYGSEDGVLNMGALAEGREHSADYTEVCIEGGNHADFGSYGEQARDGVATISREEQWEQTVEAVAEFERK